MKKILFFISVLVFVSSTYYAQKDTVVVPGYYETGRYGTLNEAVDAAKAAGTTNNTVFKLNHYDAYVLSRSIFIDHGESLEIYAPKAGRDQESAPPQIVWTEEGIDRAYIIQSYGDIKMQNIWVRYADFLGNKVSSSITFENQTTENKLEYGYFDGVLFDYAGIGAEASGAICVKADGFHGEFYNCHWRNNSDNHFQYYGRAVSFPYESSGWHNEYLLFENCTFTNIARIVMQEGNEYSDNVHLNHCTILNTVEWVYQSAGWLRNFSITNSIVVNPYMMGYTADNVCTASQTYNDFLAGKCDPPGGGLINGITPVDSFGFQVDFTDFDRKLFVGNTAYLYQDFFLDWFNTCGWCRDQIRARNNKALRNPFPMLGEDELAFIDSVDGEGNKVFKTLNVDWETIYDEDPDFIVPATNLDTMKLFMEFKWSTAADVDWSYKPEAGYNHQWPLPENLAYNNAAYKTAAMGGFPLGDLNWYPELLPAWEAQREAEWTIINNWLDHGSPDPSSVREIDGNIPDNFVLKQNYPNPFNPTTQIEYSIPKAGYVSLKIYNTLGQEVATLFDGNQNAGNYVATFNANTLASGIYIYKLQSDNVSISKKLVLMK